jgi:hypothetical protein
MRFTGVVACALIGIPVATSAQSEATCDGVRNTISFAMYFNSRPQDRAQCAMRVVDGRVAVDPGVSNPAMSCPDMFAWKLFGEAVREEFWKGWAADQFTWPAEPLPLCVPGSDPSRCCTPGSRSNPGYEDETNPAKHCPYLPADFSAEKPYGPLPAGRLPSKAHALGFVVRHEQERRRLAELAASPDAGREIRQSMAELVYRNPVMLDYTFRNGLYHQEGVAAVFARNAANVKDAPYRGLDSAGGLVEIDYPTQAVMIKSNWISVARAKDLGLVEDPSRPYVKMTMLSPVTDNNAPIFKKGDYWLVAFHVSSKDIPNWVWATFEHADNPGRCDYTGCNDSYGYASEDVVAAKQARNYTAPKVRCDRLPLAGWIFDTDKRYPAGAPSPPLAAVLDGLGIGTAGAASAGAADGRTVPSRHDRAWRSYRLKGSQTEFTDSMGRNTLLGNSVTEGGFMTTSSCISCHARAASGPSGPIPPPLGVFVNELSETGYGQSHRGIPVADWFHRSAQPPTLQALQTDFVWGFLGANCVKPVCGCNNEPRTCNVAQPAPLKGTVRDAVRR